MAGGVAADSIALIKVNEIVVTCAFAFATVGWKKF
jgi:hypothetical protein